MGGPHFAELRRMADGSLRAAEQRSDASTMLRWAEREARAIEAEGARLRDRGMELHALAARRRAAERASDGAAVLEVDRAMHAAGIASPARMAAYLVGPP